MLNIQDYIKKRKFLVHMWYMFDAKWNFIKKLINILLFNRPSKECLPSAKIQNYNDYPFKYRHPY